MIRLMIDVMMMMIMQCYVMMMIMLIYAYAMITKSIREYYVPRVAINNYDMMMIYDDDL